MKTPCGIRLARDALGSVGGPTSGDWRRIGGRASNRSGSSHHVEDPGWPPPKEG
jgi:hypothetical protein